MPYTENYDILVIGSGEAGKYLEWTMAGQGHRTAVIERQLIGGSCPNIACLPSKKSSTPRRFARSIVGPKTDPQYTPSSIHDERE